MRGRVIRHKYHAKSVEDDGIKFSSRLEHKYYKQLMLRKQSGEILFFLMQVPFSLPGKKKYRLDFLEFHANGEVVCSEVKGMDTQVGVLKLAMVEDLYGIKINIVRKA